MGFPFEKIDGKPIDFNNQQHRDIVIKRQKTLNNTLENGLCITKVRVNIKVEVEFQCVKCGNDISEYLIQDYGIDIYEFELDLSIVGTHVKCLCCKTKYVYSYRDEVFYLKLADQLKEQLKTTKR